ncbi:ran-binding protein M homolog [Selaginella moellendorffii]|nr:ran-binding protein M homolog [Selaginella moellendorffii]|eukprot:XP_002992236.2 ran-binding protein M homolog [Selaginella moellendorffii]
MPMVSTSPPDLEPTLLALGMRKPEDDDGDEEEEAPSFLNTNNCGHFLGISMDKLTAKYNGEGKHGNDVGAVQGNRPAPSRRLCYYFEMTVCDRGQKGVISIGFSDQNFKTSRQPGWEPNSYGYHGDDGKLYYGPKSNENLNVTFTTNDTVGAGINYLAQELFFTKNSKLVGKKSKDVKVPLYPTIGLHSPNEKVSVNFGQNPFVFDVEALIQEEREKRQAEVENVPLPLSVSHSIVRAYLLHYGYQETLEAFDDACGGTFPSVVGLKDNGVKPVQENYALHERNALRRLAREGDVDGVFSKLREWYPEILEDGRSAISFLLHCQKFIELVKAGSLEAAVTYARAELVNFFGNLLFQSLLQDCLALLAYEKPAESPVCYLLKVRQREAVADAVNAVILAMNPNSSGPSPQSTLEKLLRQLTCSQREVRAINGDQGEVFRLHKVLQGSKDGGW